MGTSTACAGLAVDQPAGRPSVPRVVEYVCTAGARMMRVFSVWLSRPGASEKSEVTLLSSGYLYCMSESERWMTRVPESRPTWPAESEKSAALMASSMLMPSRMRLGAMSLANTAAASRASLPFSTDVCRLSGMAEFFATMAAYSLMMALGASAITLTVEWLEEVSRPEPRATAPSILASKAERD